MDGFINSKIEAQTIYEIYRACRLCGAGAGYKMPIIQNVVDLDGAEVELKQKIRDCVQIEVHQDDKMPPLICELCVDKVNDFYEFLEMCRQTNKRTRLRLGLPPQTMPRGAPDAEDCILGITEPVFIDQDSSEPVKTRTQVKNLKASVKNVKSKPQDTKVKITLPTKKETRGKDRIQPRSLRSKQPSPPRLRGTKRSHDDDVSLGSLQRAKRSAMPLPKSILKKNEVDENSLLTLRSRASKEKDVTVKKETSKKVQIVVKSPPRVNKNQGNSQNKCKICKIQYSNHWSYNNHMRVHANKKPADQKPSSSRRSREVECNDCNKTFLSKHLLDIHTCSKKGVNCDTCGRKFPTNKAMSKHKSYCLQKKKASAISPALLRKLKPMQIRMSRCDSILESCQNGHYDVSNIPFDYGLDRDCTYPYISRLRIKSEPSYMVSINDEIKEAFDADKYIHWDSEDTASDMDVEDLDTVKKVESLTSIALKNIFSPKLLGKVPKKRRKVKAEKAFDSILNASDFDSDIRLGIDSIIDRLDDTIDVSKDRSGDNDSLFGDDKAPTVTNDDFDALFGDTQNNDKNDDVNKVNDSKENKGEGSGETIENDENVRTKDDTVSSEIENAVSEIKPVNIDEGINKENDENARTKDDTVSSEIENTVSEINPVNNDEGINNENDEIKESESCEKIEEINESRTVESSESGHNDKIEESIENNESSKNNVENTVQNDDINEKCSLDLDKLNETESREVISENESIDKNNGNEQINELDIIKEVTNNDQLNDKVDEKFDENHQNYIENKSDETLQPRDLKMEDDTDNKDSTDNKNDGENVKMTDATDKNENESTYNKNDVENVTTDKNDAEDIPMTDSTDKNEVNDVTNTSESTDDKTQQISPDNKESAQNDKTYVNGEMDVDEKFNMDDLEDVSDSEMDDKKLMDELDAQIGEDDRKIINN